MKYTVYTLFPELLTPWRHEALLGKAIESGLVELDVRDLRRFSTGRHNKVDDTPYGGGAGMVIRVDVAAAAIAEVRREAPAAEVVLLSPAGERFDQKVAEDLARSSKHLCLLSGRYEGFDARVDGLVDRELSVGDYVLMGGELAALAVIEATARLIPGVLGAQESFEEDSFTTGLLDYPEYTRPPEFEGMTVPEVLKSGHHGKVAEWRRRQALLRTLARRPDLLESAALSARDEAILAELQSELSLARTGDGSSGGTGDGRSGGTGYSLDGTGAGSSDGTGDGSTDRTSDSSDGSSDSRPGSSSDSRSDSLQD